MPAKFEIKAGRTGKFRFNLKASNGQVILTSEAYEKRAAAAKGIDAIAGKARRALDHVDMVGRQFVDEA